MPEEQAAEPLFYFQQTIINRISHTVGTMDGFDDRGAAAAAAVEGQGRVGLQPLVD
jgi:hypothetical protein